MNLLNTITRALAYSADVARPLAREAFDVALDRSLALVASHRPTRVVAREDYMLRSYLAGRVGKGFPEGTPATFGGLNGTAYLHCIRTPDAGRAHHSHPWEWAVSVVLTGGYAEEVVEADGSITGRQRLPGSVGLISSTSFHRISGLYAPRVWTLFIVGPRTRDRAWYFRRLDGSIVHEADYHANLEQEHQLEQQWIAEVGEREAEAERARAGVAAVVTESVRLVEEWRDQGLVRPGVPRYTLERTPGAASVVVGGVELFRVEPTAEEDASGDEEVPAEPEEEAKDWWADSFDAALGGSLTAFPAAPRATFRDGEVVALTCAGSAPAREVSERTPSLVVAELQEAARRFHEAVLQRGEGSIVSPPESMPESVAAMRALGWYRSLSPTVLVRHGRGGIDVIRLATTRSAARGGQSCPTWAHRCDAAMFAAAAPLAALGHTFVVTAESTAYRTVDGEMCLGPFVAREHGLERPGLALSSNTETDPLKAFAELRTLIEARDGMVKSSQRVVVVDAFGRTVVPPIEAGPSFEPADPHDPLDWAAAIEQRQPSDTPSEAHGDILLEWPWNPSDPSSAIKTLRFDSPEAARAHAMKHGLVGFRVLEPTAVAQVVDQAAPTVTTTSPTRTSLLVGGRPGVQQNADRDGMVALYGEKSWPVRVFDGEVPPAGDWRSISAEPFAPTPENMSKAVEAMRTADWQDMAEQRRLLEPAPEESAAAHGPLGVPVVVHWPSPDIEKRLMFSDGSIAEIVIDEPNPYDRAFAIRRNWRSTGENMAASWAKRDLERYTKYTKGTMSILPPLVEQPLAAPASSLPRVGVGEAARLLHDAVIRCGWGLLVSPPESMHEAVNAMLALGWHRPADPKMLVRGRLGGIDVIHLTEMRGTARGRKPCPTWLHGGDADLLAAVVPIALFGVLVVVSEAPASAAAEPTAPEGYTFEKPGPSPMIIVRHGDSYVGSLLSNGAAVAHGREVPTKDMARHADAWAHARALRAREVAP